MKVSKFRTLSNDVKTHVITSFGLFQIYNFERDEFSECLIPQELIESLEKKEVTNYFMFHKEYEAIITLAQTLSVKDSPYSVSYDGYPNFIVTIDGEVHIGRDSSMHEIAKKVYDYKEYLRSININGYCREVVIEL